jgi:hypothetical protein
MARAEIEMLRGVPVLRLSPVSDQTIDEAHEVAPCGDDTAER